MWGARSPRQVSLVGMATLCAVGAAAAILVVFRGNPPWRRTTSFSVEFGHVGALRAGAPVLQGGRTVGRVESMRFLPATSDGSDVVAVARVALERRYASMVPSNSEVFVGTRGSFSEARLELGPPAAGAAPGPPIAEGATVRGIDPPTLDRVLSRAWNNLTIAREFALAVRPELEALVDEVGKLQQVASGDPTLPRQWRELVASVGPLVREVATLRQTVAEVKGGSGKGVAPVSHRAGEVAREFETSLRSLAVAVEDLRGALLRVASHVDDRGEPAWRQLRESAVRLRDRLGRVGPILQTASELAGAVARGQGTIGKLLHDPEFPEDAKELGKILKRQPWRIIGHPDDEGVRP